MIGDRGDPSFAIPALQLVPVFVLVVGLLGPALLGGIGLLRCAVWGRPVVTVTAILMLFLALRGTIAGLAALAVLHRRRPGGAGLAVTPLGGRTAQVHGATYVPSLKRLSPKGSPVVLEQWPAPGRSTLDPPRLVLHCRACDVRLAFDGAGGRPERDR